MGYHPDHQQWPCRYRLWPVGAVLCNGRLSIGCILPGASEAGVRPAPLYPLCRSQGSRRVCNGNYACHLLHLQWYRIQSHVQYWWCCHRIVTQYNQDLAEWEQAVKNGQKPAEKQHRPPERQSVRNRLRQFQEDGKQNSQPKQRKKSQDRER